jgi:voltage-gated potassium channel
MSLHPLMAWQERWRAAGTRLEPLTSVLALLVIPALIIEARATAPEPQLLANVFNWIVWLAFCLEFGCFFLADPGWRVVRQRWLDVAIIVLAPPFLVPESMQSARAARAVRLIRLLRFVRIGVMLAVALRQLRRMTGHRRFHFVALVGMAIVLFGALGVFLVEGHENPSVSSFGNAVWWAIVTATTVGYGDVSPVSTEGRVIAVILMLTGIGIIGVFTATVASFFLEPEVNDDTAKLAERLDVIEAKLDRLLAERTAAGEPVGRSSAPPAPDDDQRRRARR